MCTVSDYEASETDYTDGVDYISNDLIQDVTDQWKSSSMFVEMQQRTESPSKSTSHMAQIETTTGLQEEDE